jgi:hypothetical protein
LPAATGAWFQPESMRTPDAAGLFHPQSGPASHHTFRTVLNKKPCWSCSFLVYQGMMCGAAGFHKRSGLNPSQTYFHMRPGKPTHGSTSSSFCRAVGSDSSAVFTLRPIRYSYFSIGYPYHSKMPNRRPKEFDVEFGVVRES